MKNNLFVAYVIGVAGIILIVSGVRNTTPLVTLQTILTGKVPDKVPDPYATGLEPLQPLQGTQSPTGKPGSKKPFQVPGSNKPLP